MRKKDVYLWTKFSYLTAWIWDLRMVVNQTICQQSTAFSPKTHFKKELLTCF